ncbi:10061_t:CDS:2 [Acaulospora colombiana]|uniref:10061_t:CDS:1 n=1 Tax=Acaulospora colombiana TaxID=27376 RepID=A0ACA9MLB0_9GLOM|nr:10061_t:CDS:2 [Acaulospora colombiana]
MGNIASPVSLRSTFISILLRGGDLSRHEGSMIVAWISGASSQIGCAWDEYQQRRNASDPNVVNPRTIGGVGALLAQIREEKDAGMIDQGKADDEAGAELTTRSIPPDRPTDNQEAVGDPYKTLFIARLVGIFFLFFIRAGVERSQPKAAKETDLRREFEMYGPIDRIKIVKNKNGNSRGYGFIVYERERDMKCLYHFVMPEKDAELTPSSYKLFEAGNHEDLEEASEVVPKRSPTSWVEALAVVVVACGAEWVVPLADAALVIGVSGFRGDRGPPRYYASNWSNYTEFFLTRVLLETTSKAALVQDQGGYGGPGPNTYGGPPGGGGGYGGMKREYEGGSDSDAKRRRF